MANTMPKEDGGEASKTILGVIPSFRQIEQDYAIMLGEEVRCYSCIGMYIYSGPVSSYQAQSLIS